MALTLGDSTTYIPALIGAGADALSNLYYLQFISQTQDGLITDVIGKSLAVRAEDITLPQFTHEVYSTDFMTIKADFPKPSISGDKSLSFTFRVDAHYDVYKFLLRQQAVTSIPNLGYAASALSEEEGMAALTDNQGFIIKVHGMRSPVTGATAIAQSLEAPTTPGFKAAETGYTELYTFKHCWIKKIDPLEFGYDSTDPLKVKITVKFMDYLDPQNLLLTSSELGIAANS